MSKLTAQCGVCTDVQMPHSDDRARPAKRIADSSSAHSTPNDIFYHSTQLKNRSLRWPLKLKQLCVS